MATAKRQIIQIIDARAAAKAAEICFQQLFPEKIKFRFEQVELSEDQEHWIVIIGFDEPPAFIGSPKQKIKTFKVNAQTGAVVSMRGQKAEASE
jgi:hypothetical protein